MTKEYVSSLPTSVDKIWRLTVLNKKRNKLEINGIFYHSFQVYDRSTWFQREKDSSRELVQVLEIEKKKRLTGFSQFSNSVILKANRAVLRANSTLLNISTEILEKLHTIFSVFIFLLFWLKKYKINNN